MKNEVHLIANVGTIVTEPTIFSGVTTSVISGQTTIDLTQLPFDCSITTQYIEVGAVLNVPSATGNANALVTAYDPNTCTIEVNTPITWTASEPATISVTLDVTSNTVESVMLDLYPNESISQNWQFQDLNTFNALGAFTRQFRIPATGTNVHIIGALDDANFNNTQYNTYSYFHVKLPAEIRVNTLPIASGYLRVMKVYKQLDKFTDFEVAFYAETPDLVKAIGEKKLAELTDLVNLNHVVNYDNVQAAAVSTDLMYGLCDRGQRWSELGEEGTRPVLNALQPVYAGDLTPALKWSYIMQQIFDDAGFVLNASTLMSYLESYWMVWCNSKNITPTDLQQQFFFSAYINSDLNITTFGMHQIEADEELYDNGGDYNAGTYTYTSPIIGSVTFQAWVKFDIGTSVTDYQNITVQLVASKNGNVVFPTVFASNTYYAQSANDVLLLSGQVAINLEIGDTVEFYVQILGNITSSIETFSAIDITLLHESDSGLLNEGCGFQIISVAPVAGHTMNMPLNAPDMKQIDFVRDVIAMHNCMIIPNRQIPNEVSVIPALDYIGSGNIVDWTSKLDISKDITIYGTQDLQRKKTTFTYASTDDAFNKLFADNGRVYGNYEINGYRISAEDVPSDFLTGEMTVQLVTRPTPCANIPGTTITIPMFLNPEFTDFVAPGPRCLYDAGGYDIIMYDDGAAGIALTNVRTWNHYSDINAQFDDYDLNWSPETPIHNITTNPYNNLFNLYWRDYLNGIYSSEARIMEAYFALDLTDIISFSFGDQIYVKEAYWRIIEINDYKIGDVETTQVKLMKLVTPAPDCALIPVAVGLDGIVVFNNQEGDPASATEACCVRYGYAWNGTDCFANIGGDIIVPDDPGGVRRSLAIQSTSEGFNNIMSTFALDAAANVTQSVFAGQFITADSGNSRSLAVGDTLTISGDVRGAAVIGKNALTKTSGFHIGGGWLSDDRTNSNGQVQSGTVMFSAKDTWNASGDAIELLIEGIASNRLNLPNNTGWACMLIVNVATDNIGNYGYGVFTFYLKKTTTTSASAVNTVYTANTFSTFTLNASIDTATNTAQHRLRITATGTGFPHSNIRIVGALHYTQFIT
jgi:hypothetical protein